MLLGGGGGGCDTMHGTHWSGDNALDLHLGVPWFES
jgi:hypothetical protein